MKLSRACDLLGIKPGEQKEEIKRKYRQMMLEIHPDAYVERTAFQYAEDSCFSVHDDSYTIYVKQMLTF